MPSRWVRRPTSTARKLGRAPSGPGRGPAGARGDPPPASTLGDPARRDQPASLRPPRERLAALSAAHCAALGPRWPRASAAALRLSRPAAGRPAPVRPARTSPAARSCSTPTSSSSPATSCSGGIPPPAAAPAWGRATAPPIPLWLPYLAARYVAQTGDHAILDEPVPFLEGPPIPEVRRASTSSPARRARRRPYTNIAAAPSTSPRPDRAARPAADRQRRLERRPQPFRRRRRRARAYGSASSSTTRWSTSPASPRSARAPPRPAPTATAPSRSGCGWTACGTRTATRASIAGNGDAISWFDALMGSWPVLSGAVGFERGRHDGRIALAALERDHRSCCSRPISTTLAARPRQDRRTIRPACARTAASTPTALHGWSTR